MKRFQSSFELTGYITEINPNGAIIWIGFQSSFELTGYITTIYIRKDMSNLFVSKLFRAYGLYNVLLVVFTMPTYCFKALSSLRVI